MARARSLDRITRLGNNTLNTVERAQHAVAEIRLLARLDGIDVPGPKDVDARKPRCEERLFRVSFVASEGFLFTKLTPSCPADWTLALRPVLSRGTKTWHIGSSLRIEWSWPSREGIH